MSDRKDRDELEQEQNRRSRLLDLFEERKHDDIRGVKRAEFQHCLIELNVRLAQYVQQFDIYALGFLITQTMYDFRKEYEILQDVKHTGLAIDFYEPVIRWQGKLIYIDEFIHREDFSSGMPEFFTFKEPLKMLGG